MRAQEDLSQKHKISVPLSAQYPALGAKYSFSYEKPANINVVGSYARKTDIRTEGRVVIDLAVTMPSV